MVENKISEVKHQNTTNNPTLAKANGSTDFKWGSSGIQTTVEDTFSKIREARTKTEQEIYESIKRFEIHTGIKIVKLDFETSKDKFNPKVKIVLERI